MGPQCKPRHVRFKKSSPSTDLYTGTVSRELSSYRQNNEIRVSEVTTPFLSLYTHPFAHVGKASPSVELSEKVTSLNPFAPYAHGSAGE